MKLVPQKLLRDFLVSFTAGITASLIMYYFITKKNKEK